MRIFMFILHLVKNSQILVNEDRSICLPIVTGARSYIFTSPGIHVLKRRREDTFWGAKSESRVSAPFFASKTV
jgi:hypothetical protein